ncbi:MAG TPA: DUF1540 domain-containing protein [Ruminococcaceae bacterium]|nr:DUF1540 domain-containing protein [Oscillospiraceae bacterium]
MTNLQCSVTNCASNSDNCCCRPDIKVKGRRACSSSDTCCSSFQEKNEAAQNALRFDMPNPITNVRCDADNCKHNTGGKCEANQISIDGAGASNSIQTLCSSFEAR